MLGKKVYSEKNSSDKLSGLINLSSEHRGVYFYKAILEDNKTVQGKIVIQ